MSHAPDDVLPDAVREWALGEHGVHLHWDRQAGYWIATNDEGEQFAADDLVTATARAAGEDYRELWGELQSLGAHPHIDSDRNIDP